MKQLFSTSLIGNNCFTPFLIVFSVEKAVILNVLDNIGSCTKSCLWNFRCWVLLNFVYY